MGYGIRSMYDKKENQNQKRPLQAVIFDMDGLMFDTERIVQRSWDFAGEQLGYGKLGHNIYQTLGMNLAGRSVYFRKTYGEDFPFEEFTEVYRRESRRIMKTEGVPVKKGLFELLEVLKEKQIPMAVATSSSERHAVEKLGESGTRPYFQLVFCGNMVARSKPDPEIYIRTAEKLGCDPDKTVVLEDSANGLKAALRAGMIPIMIPDLLENIPELEPLIEAKLPDLKRVAEYLETHFFAYL